MFYTSQHTGEEIDSAIFKTEDLEAEVNEIKTNINTINNSINTINNGILTINSSIDTINNEKFSTVNNQINLINKNLNNLQILTNETIEKLQNFHPSLFLPSEYIPLEYISATAGPLLKTNLTLDFNKDIDVSIVFKLGAVGVRHLVFGNYPTTPNLNVEITTGNLFRLYLSESSTYDLNGKTAMVANTVYHCRLVWDKNTSIFKLYLNNNLEITSDAMPFFKNYSVNPFTLFLDTRDSSAGTFTKQISIYKYIVKEDNNIIMDLYPCIQNDGTKVFFDKINNTLFKNSGSGSFVAGTLKY